MESKSSVYYADLLWISGDEMFRGFLEPFLLLQSMKTRVIKSNLNPVWNERLMLSIPDPIPLLKLVSCILISKRSKDVFTKHQETHVPHRNSSVWSCNLLTFWCSCNEHFYCIHSKQIKACLSLDNSKYMTRTHSRRTTAWGRLR